MVTNLTNYGKQIRFMLSTDDPAAVEWQNGDLVFLMDQNKLYVFDADNTNFKEISMGGGGGGGGGGGLALLTSGVYTAPSSVLNLNIPVSYSGTPKFTMIVADDPPVDTAQTVMAFFIPSFPVIGNTLSPHGYGGYVDRTAANATNHGVISRGLATFNISNTVLTFGRPAPSYPWIAGVTYHWYIYGE